MLKEIESGRLPIVLKSPTPFALEFGNSSIDHLGDTLESNVDVYYVNVDKVPEIKDAFKVKDLPTMILFKDGEPQDTLVGYHDEQELYHFLNQ